MPIYKTVKGDLIKMAKAGDFPAIVHGCNCFHTMGSGIAKAIRDEWPGVHEVDVNTTRQGDPDKLGTFSVHRERISDHRILTIFNAYTQYYYGTKERHVSYEAIGKVFGSINYEMVKYKPTFDSRLVDVGIPKIGGGLAGGDWDVISSIIDAVTPNIRIALVVL